MAHIKERQIYQYFKKQLKAWPVVCLLGPRQCGKSTFLRELAFKQKISTYRTFDNAADRRRAQSSPEAFLATVEHPPLVLDEAQKVPEIFDEIKALVDNCRIPGSYILSGSVQFSQKVGIRESLTGRTAIIKMDTMTIRETLSEKSKTISLGNIIQYLHKGGMPGACFMRDAHVREDYWSQWLDTLCERDIRQYSGGRLSTTLTRDIIETIAKLEEPTTVEIARSLRVDSRRITNIIGALTDLFIIREVPPCRYGVGKPLYFLFDCCLATYLGSSQRRLLQIWFLSEYQNQHEFKGTTVKRPEYYRKRGGAFVDFYTPSDNSFHVFCEQVTPDAYFIRSAESAIANSSTAKCNIYAATETPEVKHSKQILIAGWQKVSAHN